MRFALILGSAALLLGSAPAASAAPSAAPTASVATVEAPIAGLTLALQQTTQQPPAKGEVDVDVDLGQDGTSWYLSPFWITVGVIALVVIVLLAVMAGRSGGNDTTVVR